MEKRESSAKHPVGERLTLPQGGRDALGLNFRGLCLSAGVTCSALLGFRDSQDDVIVGISSIHCQGD